MNKTTFVTAAMLTTLAAMGCAPVEMEGQGSAAERIESATITFGADWSQRVAGSLVAGRQVRVVFDAARLPQCRGETNGQQAWAIGGFFRVNGGAAQSFSPTLIGGASPYASAITLPSASGRLEMWFQVTSRWGCNAWDSNYGNNYRFTVQADPNAPGWVGDGAVVISRATCGNGLACDADRRAITSQWTYETWARQRAAIRVVTFDVWKQGVTDRDNPDLWRQLDVQLRYRFGRTGAFAMRHVNFERRVGNNARYAVDLRGVDPLPDFPALTACPAAPLTASPDGALVSTTFEYYFTVNGTEYRPSATGVFQGVFTNYKTPLLATCLPR